MRYLLGVSSLLLTAAFLNLSCRELLTMAYTYSADPGAYMSAPIVMDPGMQYAPAYGGYSPYMPMQMPAVSGLDHTQGKWFAPGEALPPGFVVSAHPEGHTAPQENHPMSDMARESFVIPASTAAAAVKASSALKKSKKTKKKKASGCC